MTLYNIMTIYNLTIPLEIVPSYDFKILRDLRQHFERTLNICFISRADKIKVQL